MNVTARQVANAASATADEFNDIIGIDDVANRIELAIDAAFRMFALRILAESDKAAGQVEAG
jgi:hypothetical protein